MEKNKFHDAVAIISELIQKDQIGHARQRAEDWVRHAPHDLLAWQYEVMTRLFDGDAEASEKSCRQALQLAPDLPRNKANLGLTLMTQGRYAEGLPLYEERYARELNATDKVSFHDVDVNRKWYGESIVNKRILLVGEQGLGDQIQFIRFASELHALGAKEVHARVHPALVGLLSSTPGVDFTFSEKTDPESYDIWCPILSLPLLLQLKSAPNPAHLPYLTAHKNLSLAWGQQLSDWFQKRPVIGMVWAGNPGNSVDGRRSLKTEQMLTLLQARGHAVAVSLQLGNTGMELLNQQCANGMVPLLDMLTDFSDTAAVVSHLDLIISVDTAVAHLAGALGKEVWLLLPKGPDWRWGLKHVSTPWYPSMRLFRQPTAGDWGAVLIEVSDALRTRYGPMQSL